MKLADEFSLSAIPTVSKKDAAAGAQLLRLLEARDAKENPAPFEAEP